MLLHMPLSILCYLLSLRITVLGHRLCYLEAGMGTTHHGLVCPGVPGGHFALRKPGDCCVAEVLWDAVLPVEISLRKISCIP